LKNNTTLEKVYFKDNDISCYGISNIVEAMYSNATLQTFDTTNDIYMIKPKADDLFWFTELNKMLYLVNILNKKMPSELICKVFSFTLPPRADAEYLIGQKMQMISLTKRVKLT